MSTVFVLKFWDHTWSAEDGRWEEAGVYTTLSLALEAAKPYYGEHEDDKCLIREYHLNQPDQGQTVWLSRTGLQGRYRHLKKL